MSEAGLRNTSLLFSFKELLAINIKIILIHKHKNLNFDIINGYFLLQYRSYVQIYVCMCPGNEGLTVQCIYISIRLHMYKRINLDIK